MRTTLLALLLAPGLLACGGGDQLLYAPKRVFAVDAVDGSFTYTSRDPLTPQRTIPLRVRVPRGAQGPLPAIVVIHGGGFVPAGHRSLADWGEQLARAGYVAIHFGNAEDEGGSHCGPLQVPLAECTADAFTREVAEGGTIYASLYSRPQDTRALLDRLEEVEALAGVSLDRDRLGVLGHSGGAHAALSLAGLAVDVSPSVRAQRWGEDPRLKVFVANSPQGLGRTGIFEGSWQAITRPVLIQTGSGDVHEGEPAARRRDAFRGLPGPHAYEHFIDDVSAKHAQFGLEQDEGVEGHELSLARTALAFLDASLRDDAAAKAWLESEQLSRATGGVSQLSRK